MRIITIGHSTTSNIYITSEYVSSNHAELLLMDNGDIFLTDKGSRNGTYLFGKRINPNQEIPVRRGDRIDFDDVPLNWAQVPTIQPLDPTKVKGVYGIGKNSRNKYILAGETVSRFHATLKEMKSGKWYIQDHSTNGTFINGARIPSNQDHPLKHGDTIVCGSVSFSNPVPPSVPIKLILAAVAAVAVICCLVILEPWKKNNPDPGPEPEPVIKIDTTHTATKQTIAPSQRIDPNYATVCVQCFARINVIFDKENDTQQLQEDFIRWGLDKVLKEMLTIEMKGTAFFVSKDGILLTNRHVVDYSYYMKCMQPEALTNLKRDVIEVMKAYIEEYYYSSKAEEKIQALNPRLISFETEPLFIGIAYPDRNYTCLNIGQIEDYEQFKEAENKSRAELDPVTVIKSSDNDEVDVAVIRLNSYKTPEYAQYFDLTHALLTTESLNYEDEYCTMGYPGGEKNAFELNKNKMTSSITRLRLKQRPGAYRIMFDGTAIPGQSGSAVYNKDMQLIGVLTESKREENVALVCPISHAIDLLKDVVGQDNHDKLFISNIDK